jgi:hypothetical protein
MKHLQNQNEKTKQSKKITPNFERRCQQERFGFAAGGFMMYRPATARLGPGRIGPSRPASFRGGHAL